MPKQTFYNLAQEKQNKIIEVAKAEFTAHGFYDVSINKIIKDAGISRGSFYQYFETKEELFLYLFDQCSDVLLKELVELLDGKRVDPFELFVIAFDSIIEKEADSWKQFFVTTISNINIRLVAHLQQFILESQKEKKLDCLFSFLDHEGIRKRAGVDWKVVYCQLVQTTLTLLGICLNDLEHKEEYRELLLGQMELIKYGVLEY